MIRRMLAVSAALLVLMISLQINLDARKHQYFQESARPFVAPQADLVKLAGLGYHTLVADAYWLSAIQYFANQSATGKPPNDLYPMTDFITDIDPKFYFAYYFTGLNLMINDGSGRDIRLILEKGKKNCPDYWKIPFQLGFFYYYGPGRYDLAADNLDRAYELTHRKNYALLAARIRSQGGNPETAVRLLTLMMQGTDDPGARQTFQQRIDELKSQVILNELNRAVDQYFSTEGKYPSRAADLVNMGLIARIPQHPVAGHKFKYFADRHKFDNDPPIYTGVFDRRKKKQQDQE